MDLLGGYGSDADASSGGEGEVPTTEPSLVQRGVPDQVGAKSSTPNPREQNGTLLQNLPAPKARRRKPVHFRIPITIAPDSDEEDERPVKKLKTTSKGLSLSEVLPPPRIPDVTGKAGLLGSGVATASGNRNRLDDSDDEMAAPDPFRNQMVLGEGNEAYRVFDDPSDVPTANTIAPAATTLNDFAQANSYQGYDSYTAGSGAYEAAPVQPISGDQLLQQALEAEAAKASRNGVAADPFAGVQFKEVNQQKLKYMPPEQREARNATRTAFGADYEARIREEAGPQPEKTARRKHQIHSLYHHAKMKELEMMDMRGQAVKTKRETQAKYGWS